MNKQASWAIVDAMPEMIKKAAKLRGKAGEQNASKRLPIRQQNKSAPTQKREALEKK
jgi:hypothetical protein